MNKDFETQYQDALKDILKNGDVRRDRTGVGTRMIPGVRIEHDWRKGAPVLTGRKIAVKTAIAEMMFFVSGSTNINDAPAGVQKWWRPQADANGEMGQGSYGAMLRRQRWVTDSGHVHEADQIKALLMGLRVSPTSRRHVLSTWNAAAMDHQCLPPCHGSFTTFHCRRSDYLDMVCTQRSGDMGIGVPHNIAQYGALQFLVAHLVGRKPGKLIYTINDAHIYSNHVNHIGAYLAKDTYSLPRYEVLGNHSSFDTMGFEPIVVQDYRHSGPITGWPMAL